MSSPLPGPGQSHRRHRSPGAQAAELCRVWQELCVRERQARDRNRQLLRDFGHLETQLGLLWARTDAVRRRKVDYDAFLQRLLLHPRMEAGSPGQVPQHQDWVSAWILDPALRSCSGRHLPDAPQWMDHLQYRTSWPHPVSPTQFPEPAAFLASTGAGGAGPLEARPTVGPHGTPWLHRGPITKDHGYYRMLAAVPHQESSPLLHPHRLGFPSTAESKGTRPQPTQTRARAGAGTHPEDAASSEVRHRHRAANRASRRLLWRGAWEQDSTETACEEPWNRVPRLWCKEKTGGDTTVLDQGGSWCQEPCGEQARDDRPEESQGKPRRRLNVRLRQTVGNRDHREGAQLKGERGQVPIQGVGQLEGKEGHSAMGQTQKEEEEEEGLAGGLGGQEREEDEEGNEGLVGRQGDQEAGEKDEEANGGEDKEDLVERRGQEECGLAGGQRSKEEDSEEEEGLVWGQKGQEGGEDEEVEGEEGLAGGQGSEEEEGSKEEEDLPKELGGQEEAEEEESEEEEEGLKQGKEEESSEEEEGLEGQQGGQEGGEEEKGSEGLVVGGTEGREQEEEEEDADSDLVLGALGAGAQGGPGSVEQGRGRGRETPAWNSHTPESPQDPGQDSTWEEEEEEDAESEGDEAIEAALAPQGNATEPRAKRRMSESHEWRKGRQRSPRLEEGSRKVKVVKEAPPTSTTQWPRTPPRGPAARSVTGFWGDSEELGAGLETYLRKDRSLDDQDDFYD
ncbi:unnamed protein product [Lepidochelys olivacea]